MAAGDVDDSFDPEIAYEIINIILLSAFTIITISSCIDACCIQRRKNDFYSVTAVLFPALQIADLISDIFFSLQIWFISTVNLEIQVLSVVFIVLPLTLSLLQLFMAVQRWRAIGNDMLTAWLRKYAFILYALSLATGSAFSGVQICRSNMFGLSQFSMPLNQNQILNFKTKKLWTTVLLEVE